MDSFCEMLPARCWADEDFFQMVSRSAGDGVVTDVVTGPRGDVLLAEMRRTAASLASRGFDIVVDDVWLDGEPADYATLLAGHDVWRIGLTARIAVIEAREAMRGDRVRGLGRAQLERVHRGMRYDLLLDTSTITVESAAARISALAGL